MFFAGDFFGPFQGFLITLGVPIAAWCGIFLADVILRKQDLRREGSLRPTRPLRQRALGRRSHCWSSGTVVGWGLVTNSYADWLGWQGYLFGPATGAFRANWAGSNLGVLVALVIGFVGYLLFGRAAVQTQEGAWIVARMSRLPGCVAIDMQAIFGDPSSPWCAPEYARASAGIQRLLPAFGDRTVFTRFVAPAEPQGAWVAYYEQWPFALVPDADPLYDLTAPFAAAAPHVETRDDLRQVGRAVGGGARRNSPRSCSPGCRPTAA